MSMSIVIPIEGDIEVYAYEVDPVEALVKHYDTATRFVAVQMVRDETEQAIVTFPINHQRYAENTRATALTHHLTGAYTKVNGMAIFTHLSGETALVAAGEVRAMEV